MGAQLSASFCITREPIMLQDLSRTCSRQSSAGSHNETCSALASEMAHHQPKVRLGQFSPFPADLPSPVQLRDLSSCLQDVCSPPAPSSRLGSPPPVLCPGSSQKVHRTEAADTLPTPPITPSWAPPDNFHSVREGQIYRSAYPSLSSYEYLATLGLKTVLILVGEPTDPGYLDFLAKHNIRVVALDLGGNKPGDSGMGPALIHKAHEVLFNEQSWPMLVHCNKGKHRTGCVIATFERVLGMEIGPALKDYREKAGKKFREGDENFIAAFDTAQGMKIAEKTGHSIQEME